MSNVNKSLKKYVNSVVSTSKKDFNKVISKVNDEMCKEAISIYDSYIDEFYSYKTSSYYRHREGIGTGRGKNLYWGMSIVKKSSKNDVSLYIKYSGDDMSGGYEYDEPDEVLQDVLNGIRFPYIVDGNSFPQWGLMTWSYGYHSLDFSVDGTLQDAINKFDQDFYKIATKKFYREWHKLWK